MGQDTEQIHRNNVFDERLKAVEVKAQLADVEQKSMKSNLEKLNKTVYGDDESVGLREATREMQKTVREEILPTTNQMKKVMLLGTGAFLTINIIWKILEKVL